jgi:hypothetical protein
MNGQDESRWDTHHNHVPIVTNSWWCSPTRTGNPTSHSLLDGRRWSDQIKIKYMRTNGSDWLAQSWVRIQTNTVTKFIPTGGRFWSEDTIKPLSKQHDVEWSLNQEYINIRTNHSSIHSSIQQIDSSIWAHDLERNPMEVSEWDGTSKELNWIAGTGESHF